MLVGALVMLGSSGMQIFAGIVICFFYVLLASYLEPLTNKTGQVLQYVTSIQLFCTLISGLMITHRTYEREKGIGNEAQDVALAVWLMFSTIVVFIAIVLVVGSVMLIFKKPKRPAGAAKPDETLESTKTTKISEVRETDYRLPIRKTGCAFKNRMNARNLSYTLLPRLK